MLYLTYNNRGLQDGLGAQIQRIFSVYWIAHTFNIPYIHSPILETEHNVDKETVGLFNKLTALPSTDGIKTSETIVSPFFDLDTIRSLQNNETNKNIIVKLKFLHKYIDKNPAMLETAFPHVFPWMESSVRPILRIAVHIRRGDVSKEQNSDRFIDFSYYRDCMLELHTLLENNEKPHTFHIYSEGTIRAELEHFTHTLPIVYHIDESVVEAFTDFVNADILLAGISSLSYSAALVRIKGIVLYPPFRHKYSLKNVCIRTPKDIHTHKEAILQSVRAR